MPRWLAIAAFWPLFAAGPVSAQAHLRGPLTLPAEPRVRSFDVRMTQEAAPSHLAPSAMGIIAEAGIAANARVGLGLITLGRPKLGPEWRVDGRSVRYRKPAVSFTFKF